MWRFGEDGIVGELSIVISQLRNYLATCVAARVNQRQDDPIACRPFVRRWRIAGGEGFGYGIGEAHTAGVLQVAMRVIHSPAERKILLRPTLIVCRPTVRQGLRLLSRVRA